MAQIGELRVFTKDTSYSRIRKGTEFTIHNIIIHNTSGEVFIGCEFFRHIRFGHDLSIANNSFYIGYCGPCKESSGSYFPLGTIEKYTKLVKAPEPDWEV